MAKKKPKANPDTERVKEVLRIRLDGAQLHDVVEYAKEKKWKLDEAACARLIRRADDLLAKRRDDNEDRVLALRIAQREALFARAVNGADYRTALSILADIARIEGADNGRERKDFLRLAAAQQARIEELEARLESRVTLAIPSGAIRGEKDRPEEVARGTPGTGEGRQTETVEAR